MPEPEPDGSQPSGELGVRLALGPSSSLILLVLTVAAAVIGVMFAVFIARRDLTVGRGISLIVFLGVLAAVLGSIHHVRSTEYLVTDRSALARTGFLEDRTERVHLEEVGRIVVEEPVHKRLFGMGDVRLEPDGSKGETVRFAFVDEPHALRAQLISLVEGRSDERSASATHSSSGSRRV